MGFVIHPNFPRNHVRKVIVGDHPRVIAALHHLGTEPLVLQDNLNLQEPVRAHADMSVFHLGGGNFLSYDIVIAAQLREMAAYCAIPAIQQQAEYPQDIGLNCLSIGNYIVCNTRYCVSEILTYANAAGMNTINVRQGYARCSAAVIDEHSLITADNGIADKLSGEGFDVLRIRPGFIELPGYDHGFIGGCCGKLSSDKILFCGDPATHPDGKNIIEFISAKGIQIITTDNNALFDFGGMIQVME